MSKVTVVVGGQFGSEGKGGVAAALHRHIGFNTGVRIGGPNAGHTVVDEQCRAYPLRQIPVAAAVDPECELVIAAGSEIDLEVLEGEIRLLEADGHEVQHRLWVDPQATLITRKNKLTERSRLPNGSTRKGIGAARAARALREASLVGDEPIDTEIGEGGFVLGQCLGTLLHWGNALIEGTQGYGLGSHAGYYPHCTSGDCRAVDFLAQAGVDPFEPVDVWVVLRTFPIRIAGDSGPLLEELTWTQVGVDPEFTTVTKKMRRVGRWNTGLAQDAVDANGGSRVKVALTFADYWWSELAGRSDPSALRSDVLRSISRLSTEVGAPIELVGTGPATCIPLGQTAEEWRS